MPSSPPQICETGTLHRNPFQHIAFCSSHRTGTTLRSSLLRSTSRFFRSFSRLRPFGSSCFAKASQDFVAAQDGLDDVRREAGQAEHPADVGAVAADVLGQVFEALRLRSGQAGVLA